MATMDGGSSSYPLVQGGDGEDYSKLIHFEETFRDPDSPLSVKDKLTKVVKNYFSSCNVKKSVLGLFPIIPTLRGYKVKEDLPNDIIAGVTSGVMMIPQGMAFANLSTLPPIVGLYISFFSSVTYVFLGTGRQLSWGCIAILSLMIATILDKYDNSLIDGTAVACTVNTSSILDITNSGSYNVSNITQYLTSIDLTTAVNNITDSSSTVKVPLVGDEPLYDEEAMAKRIEVASGVSMVAGLILIIASRLGLSRVASLMSDSLITGFAVGISFHVATSQLKSLLGLQVPRYNGIGKVIRTWIEICKRLPETNLAALLISVICMLVIYLVKKFINERYKKKMRIPIPIELFVVIISTLVSTYAHFHDKYDIKVVETVPIGIPAPKIPDFSLILDYIGDGVVIIVVSYAQSLAMAKTMGLKHNYAIDANQEMFSCGACSLVCGLFSGYITGASVSRSMVQDGAGGRTQVASVFAAGLVLLVIMLIGPYFYYLPMCVLSSIIVINLRTMFLKLLVIPSEWRKSRYDCAVWVFTCFATIILNADIGLLAGIVFSLFLIVLRAMTQPVIEVGQIPTSAFALQLRSLSHYTAARKLHNVKILQIKTPLYFVNADIFKSEVFAKTGVNPIKLKRKKLKEEIIIEETGVQNGLVVVDTKDTNGIRVVLLDASAVSFIDMMGVQALQFIIGEFEAVDIEVLITSVPENIIPMFHSTGFWDKHGERLFTSIESALASLVAATKT